MVGYAYTLKEIAESAGLKPVLALANQPLIRAVHRVTVQYHHPRFTEAVVTVIKTAEAASIEAVYRGCFSNKPLKRQFSPVDYAAFVAIFSGKAFDALQDQEDMPLFGVDLCLVERASGGFSKSVVFSLKAPPPYDRLLAGIRRYLPECLREVPR